MKEKPISTAALAVLSECVVDGQTVAIRSGQLDRKLYEEVDYVLRAIGGKWNRSKKVHIFAEPHEEIRDMLEGCIECEIAVPLRPGTYFPTPEKTAKLMIEIAAVKPDMMVLEPSAGDGQLAFEIYKAMAGRCILWCVEQDKKLFIKLVDRIGSLNGMFVIENEDFLTINPSVDCVIMNPPFQKLQDVDHITHAFNCLKPGGRLVSVASNSVTFRMEQRAQKFRELVANHGRIESLPENSFKESGTLVRTVLVVLDKAA